MGRIYIEVEENPNCAYHPLQTFETRTEERQVDELWIPGVPGKEGPHIAVGWSSGNAVDNHENRSGPCPVTLVEVTDSGAAVSLLVAGGDYGLRIKAAGSGYWSLDASEQWGEPYMLLDPNTQTRAIEARGD